MRVTMCSLVIVLGVGVAGAQPGQTPYAPPPPPSGVPAPYAYQPPPQQIMLTEEEHKLLEMGEISDGKHLGGGLAAVFFGYGVGQAVQGRWSDTGWIFTLGEGAATVAFVYGFVDMFANCPIDGPCNNDRGAALFLGGLLAYGVFHVWEVVDAFVVPPRHNRRVRELRARLGYPPVPYYGRLAPYLAPPTGSNDGAIGGVTLRF